jgi:hypothetical protein
MKPLRVDVSDLMQRSYVYIRTKLIGKKYPSQRYIGLMIRERSDIHDFD